MSGLFWLSIPIAFTALLAMFLLLFGDRSPHARRCPRCWYNMEGTPTLTCPECGHAAPSEQALHRPKRFPKLAALAFLTIIASTALIFPRWQRWVYFAITPTWHTEKTVAIPGYTLRILQRADPEEFPPQVFQAKDSDGHVLYQLSGWHFSIGNMDKTIGVGTASTTGAASETVIITEDYGGSGCQQTHYTFSIDNLVGRSFQPLSILHACGTFEDRDGDGIPEFIARDPTFSYRWTSGASSPYPEVILRWHWTQGRYIVATELMRKPPPSESDLKALAPKLPAIGSTIDLDTTRSDCLQVALDLIYSGNRAEGIRFLSDNWPDRAGLAEFLNEFEELLAQSPYATEIRALESIPPPSLKP